MRDHTEFSEKDNTCMYLRERLERLSIITKLVKKKVYEGTKDCRQVRFYFGSYNSICVMEFVNADWVRLTKI